MAFMFSGLQNIIDSAVNIEFNRSKLVAQNISRSGRISTASRNWANPYRFIVTPQPVWKYNDVRSVIEAIYRNDRYVTTYIYFGDYNTALTATNPVFAGYISGNILTVTSVTSGNVRSGDIISGAGVTPGTQLETRISGFGANSIFEVSRSQTVGSVGSPVAMTGDTTIQGNPSQNWISQYNGTQDTDNGNYIIDNYSSFSASGTRLIIQQQTGETAPDNDIIIRPNDFIRISGDLYPYQASRSVPVPIAVSGRTGTITSTDSVTTITGLNSVTNFSTGQVLTETGTNVGSFGGTSYIQTIDSATQITIVSDSANTAGAITFSGDGKTTANHKVAIPINRGYLGAGQPANTSLFVGAAAARFQVKVTNLPTYKFINKDLIEFTGDFELVEEIL